MKVIQLSYDHLSDHLRPCLLYLASYPKDEDIEFSELKDLWSSEGFIEPTDSKSVEEVMADNVKELISSSLVIVFNDSGDMSCQIHDIVHDFCSIKARKEKLFDLTSSIPLASSSSSSSDSMLRRQHIHYNELFCSDETPFLFIPKKKNPCAKHLLSLQIYFNFRREVLPNNFHLRHLRLVKMLDLRGVFLTDSLLNEIGMLIHLRCLNIQTQAEALPQSFSNLCNLETLKVSSWRNIVVSPSIWSLAKLRHVDIDNGSVFVLDINKPTKLENLRTLNCLRLSCSVDSEDIFKRFPNLRTLGFSMSCSAEEISFPRLDVLNKLEQVCASFWCLRDRHAHQFDFHFPESLKELKLNRFNLTSDALSRIGTSTPNLQKLELSHASIQEWDMERVTFHNLKSLKLDSVSFSEWQVNAEESFPVLEELLLYECTEIKEIPESFGDIASLKYILLRNSPQLEESALKIKEYVEDMTGEDRFVVESS